MFYALAQEIAVAGSRIPIALDSIGGWRALRGRGGWLAVETELAGENPA